MSEPVLALAASPRDWARRLHRHVTDHGGALVRRTVLHPHDTLAEAYDVLVADDTTSFLTRNLVEQLRAQGRRILGVFDPDDPRGKQDLIDLGVDDVIERGAEAHEFVQAVTALVAHDTATNDPPLVRADGPVTADAGEGGTRAVHVAVAGAGGGVGATEVALALSCAAADRGRRVVLVDADDAGPSLAQRLGASPYPNLRSAVDAVEHHAGDLARALVPVRHGAVLLPGLASSQDWVHLRPAEVLAVVARLRSLADVVVTDVGDGIEDLSAWGGPARHGVGRALIGAADHVAVVAAGSPVGVARLLAWCADARTLLGERKLSVVVNRAPRGAFARRQLEAEIAAALGPVACALAPVDPRLEQAAWSGEAVTAGPFLRAAAGVAEQLLELPAQRRRLLRHAARAS